MGAHNYREVGGGPATGLAGDFINWLQSGLNTGSFGGVTAGARYSAADPGASTRGISGILNDILSSGGGQVGGAFGEMIAKESERNANALRARFNLSGTGYGTPAAYGEALLRSETAPKLAATVGQLQMSALGQLLPLFAGLSQKGIAQREGYMEPNAFISTMQALGPVIGAGASLLTGNPLGAAASMGGMGGQFGAPSPIPNAGFNPFQLPGSSYINNAPTWMPT